MQSARAELPSGAVDQERMLVEYKLLAVKPASLMVTCIDVPEQTGLEAYLTELPARTKDWRQTVAAEPCHVEGADGVRVAFAVRSKTENTIHEIVGFKRGKRIYFFTGIFEPADTTSANQIRQTVSSIIW
jgi:hypothetical protein